ncbi:hypothetical protein GCM10022381_12740 [Leifsonia kafniensis]|uniref:Uncharacterized protein n=1 Tax=Leifsonia kafniensis TaxID=475957 RepID=A0ABP7KD34_9MICO
MPLVHVVDHAVEAAFAQPDAEHVNAQFDEVVRMLGKSHPKVAMMLDEWEAGDRRYLSEASMAALLTMNAPVVEPVEEVVSLPELTAA